MLCDHSSAPQLPQNATLSELSLDDIQRVRSSFAVIAEMRDQAAHEFYARVFDLDPKLKRLFVGSDIEEQGRKLMMTLAFTVGAIDKPDEILPAVRELGARHVRYGVEESQYQTVGQALLHTLEKILGEKFSPACRSIVEEDVCFCIGRYDRRREKGTLSG